MFKKVAIAAAIAAMSMSANALVVDFEDVDTVIDAATASNTVGGVTVYTGFLLSGIRGTGTGAISDLTTTNNNANLLKNQNYGGFTWGESAAGNLQLYSEYRAVTGAKLAGIDPYISPSGTALATPYGNWIAAVNASGSTVSFAKASAMGVTSIDFYASKANEVITVKAYSGATLLDTWASGTLAAGTLVTANFSAAFASADKIEIATTKGALGFDNITAVPEPSTYAMLLAGLGMMGVIARRRTRA